MSAIRLPQRDEEGNVRVELIDPYTRARYVPQLLGVMGSGPVEVRKATPEELARLGGEPAAVPLSTPVRKVRKEISFTRGPMNATRGVYIAHLTDDEVLEAVAVTDTLELAAARLGTSQASLSRRLRQIRARAS